jgi:ASC-1-like (ASCH) protein
MKHTQNNQFQVGDKVAFTKYFQFGKSEEVTETIVAIKKTKNFWIILTDEGSEFSTPSA